MKHNKGFTLIEILAMLIIVGVVIFLAYTFYKTSADRANQLLQDAGRAELPDQDSADKKGKPGGGYARIGSVTLLR